MKKSLKVFHLKTNRVPISFVFKNAANVGVEIKKPQLNTEIFVNLSNNSSKK